MNTRSKSSMQSTSMDKRLQLVASKTNSSDQVVNTASASSARLQSRLSYSSHKNSSSKSVIHPNMGHPTTFTAIVIVALILIANGS